MKILELPRTLFRRWQNWSLQWSVTIAVIVAILLGVGLLFGAANGDDELAEPERKPVAVETTKLANLVDDATIEISGVIKSAQYAPLVARTGGRVTKVRAHVGETVGAGKTVVEIDGQGTANPTRAQVAGARESLQIFSDIQGAALTASNNAIKIAEQNLASAVTQEPLSNEQATLVRKLADNSVESSRLTLQDARDSGTDALIRSADLAKKAAGLAQDQATASIQQTERSSGDTVELARLSLKNARDAKTSLVADLASQRSQLTTQLNIAAETARLQQVVAPVNGSITRLTVGAGDFVSPGQVIGEVDALNGAEVTINVSTGIRNQLVLGDVITMKTPAQTFAGMVAHLAAAPSNATGQWQVDLYITDTPEIIHPNETVSILLPVGLTYKNAYFIPLDAATVRQSGVVIFTISDNVAAEHIVEVINFEGDFIEARVDLPIDAEIVTNGNRLLRNDDTVSVLSP